MKNLWLKTTAYLVSCVMLLGLMLPLSTYAADNPVYELTNGYIVVSVNGVNGGFSVRTADGDKINKDDDNKNLLFPDGDYDTSFTSIRVTRNGDAKEYIFGRSYGFLGLGASEVVTTKDEGTISSVWSVDGIEITQNISLASSGSNTHGMAMLSYDVKNGGDAALIEMRVLFDTALGFQDFAVYELPGQNNVYTRVEAERTFSGDIYEKSFFAYDDVYSPTITAYSVNASVDGAECKPEKVTFAHWNNLAATVFDYQPDEELTFTNPYNKRYLTADSAYALYFNAGQVNAGAEKTVLSTYYGVFSNVAVEQDDRVSVNLVAPGALKLTADKKSYENGGLFTVSTSIQNFVNTNARDFKRVAVAVYPSNGIEPLDTYGNSFETPPTYGEPYSLIYLDFEVGETQTTKWSFRASVDKETAYRKIEYRVFDVSQTGLLLLENQIGSGSTYVLCPGGDGLLPEVGFISGTPEIIYHKGNRNIFLTGKNFNMLAAKGEYDLRVRRTDGTGGSIVVPDDKFTIDTSTNTIHVILTEEMSPGAYEFMFDFSDTERTDLTAPALKFTVSDDPKYKNEGYGVIAVVQDNQPSMPAEITYSVQAFTNEYAFETYVKKNTETEILLEFRGQFEVKYGVDGKSVVSATAVSLSSHDKVTINNCLDFEKGTLSIKWEQGQTAVNVDFDGSLYTSGARTSVWTGVAGFTSIQNGADFELIPYNYNGVRNTSHMTYKKVIKLIWPSAASIAQTVGGMVFGLRYGEMGIIDGKNETDPKTKVVAFGAQMDLSFVVPSASKTEPNLTTKEQLHLLLVGKSTYSADELRQYEEQHKEDMAAKQKAEQEKGATKVSVDDILFGGGRYIGFKCTVTVGLPSYSAAMPKMNGVITIDTINDWSAGFLGKGSMTKLEMEFEIKLRSHNNIPIPDKLYFYIAGFTPGVNIDGFGVLWIQGGGGGIDNLYETIFGEYALPPLTLLLSAKVAILQVVEARADLSISLRGAGLKVTNGKLVGVDLPVLHSAQLKFDWYPEFYFLASANLTILGIINGAGYIVVENDGFVEFYIRADISVPDDVFLFGGIKAGGADLGVNNERIWGNVNIIGLSFGVAYYWGGDVSFGSLGSEGKPTYPELLMSVQSADVPVGYDEETGRTLYMSMGDNVRAVAMSRNGMLQNLGAGGGSIRTNSDGTVHEVTLPAYANENAAITLSYAATSAEEAKTMIDIQGYPLTWMDASKPADHADNEGKNAYLRFNQTTGMASATISFADPASFDRVWNVKTDAASDIVLYAIASVPELTSLSAVMEDGKVKVNWLGSALDEFESISFYAVSADGDTALVYKTDSVSAEEAKFDLPATLATGTYTIQAVATKENMYQSAASSAGTIAHTNTVQPAVPTAVRISNAGDYYIGAEIDPPAGEYDGYVINIYEYDEITGDYVIHDAGGLVYEKGAQNIRVGGRYDSFDENKEPVIRGLTAGKRYKVGVAAYREVGGAFICSKETFSNDEPPFELRAPQKPELTVSSDTMSVPVLIESGGPETKLNAYRSGDITLTLNAANGQKVTGMWNLDGGTSEAVEGFEQGLQAEFENGREGLINDAVSSIEIPLTGLEDGEHVLTFIGKNEQGDSVIYQYAFVIDTAPPKLMISSPVNGAAYDETGAVTLVGVTDPKAYLTVSVNGKALYEGTPELSTDGVFEIPIKVNGKEATQAVKVTAADAAGNIEVTSVTLINEALGDIQSLAIYSGRNDVTSQVFADSAKSVKALDLMAVMPGGATVRLNNLPFVDWELTAVSGTAHVEQTGTVHIDEGARGIVTAKLYMTDEGAHTVAAVFGEQDTNLTQPTSDDDNPKSPGNTGTITSGGGSSLKGVIGRVTAEAGELVRFALPGGIDEADTIVRYTLPDGIHIVGMSEVIDGHVVFIAPVAGAYEIVIGTRTQFVDTEGHWAKEYIGKVSLRKLFSGIGENLFDPDGSMTRAMFVTVLSRLDNADLTDYKTTSFDDVPTGEWFSAAVEWAVQQGIVKGVGGGLFDPHRSVTREQMAHILNNYVKYKGYTWPDGEGSVFNDQSSISDWAVESVSAVHKAGVVVGKPGDIFDPQGTANRAEVATVFSRAIIALLQN